MADEKNTEIQDPCAEFGPRQRAALTWFVAVLVLGSLAVTYLAGIDRWMYDNNAEMLDWTKYKENRQAFSSVASERSDPRSRGDYSSNASQLK